MDITRQEEQLEILYKDGMRAAIIDEKGIMFMLVKAEKEDREQFFPKRAAGSGGTGVFVTKS